MERNVDIRASCWPWLNETSIKGRVHLAQISKISDPFRTCIDRQLHYHERKLWWLLLAVTPMLSISNFPMGCSNMSPTSKAPMCRTCSFPSMNYREGILSLCSAVFRTAGASA